MSVSRSVKIALTGKMSSLKKTSETISPHLDFTLPLIGGAYKLTYLRCVSGMPLAFLCVNIYAEMKEKL